MQTTAGSWALQGSIVPRDAFVVSNLRAAGAVLFGKATLSEWADMRSNYYSEGYSGRGGQCRRFVHLLVLAVFGQISLTCLQCLQPHGQSRR